MRKYLSAAAIAGITAMSSVALLVGVNPPAASAALVPSVVSVPAQIPVLDWHELNNGCDPTAAVCNASDSESVSTAQLTAELGYLKAQGYHTISPAAYLAWTEGIPVNLPAKPVLLIADNGILNFLQGSEPVLASYGFTLAVATISGFADGASDVCTEQQYQPECPYANDQGWDATWSELDALNPSIYSFIFEAGAAGHFVQGYDPSCTAFYACMVPGETAAHYESRVGSDVSAGQQEIVAKLGVTRFTPGLWVVPYSDDGYAPCSGESCTPQDSDGPAGWLTSWSARTNAAVFVEDAFRNGIQNERFRLDVQGWMTEGEFETMINDDVMSGYFTLAHTKEPTPSDVVTDSSKGQTIAPGTSLTYTVSVQGSAPEGLPTGTVTWAVSGTSGTTACTDSTLVLDDDGTATCTISNTTRGTVVVSAAYNDDENYTAAMSNADSVTVR